MLRKALAAMLAVFVGVSPVLAEHIPGHRSSPQPGATPAQQQPRQPAQQQPRQPAQQQPRQPAQQQPRQPAYPRPYQPAYPQPRPPQPDRFVVRPAPRVVVVPPRRTFQGIMVLRPYGHRYPGFGLFLTDNDAYKWLAFTAITLILLDRLTVHQQRLHEQAQIRATTAPIGETIVWQDGDASGSVIATREGLSSSGRYCREFQQEIRIGGKIEQAHGTACQQPDGAWEIVP